MVALYFVIFREARLYGEAGLQVFFFVVQGWGWLLWARAGDGIIGQVADQHCQHVHQRLRRADQRQVPGVRGHELAEQEAALHAASALPSRAARAQAINPAIARPRNAQ